MAIFPVVDVLRVTLRSKVILSHTHTPVENFQSRGKSHQVGKLKTRISEHKSSIRNHGVKSISILLDMTSAHWISGDREMEGVLDSHRRDAASAGFK